MRTLRRPWSRARCCALWGGALPHPARRGARAPLQPSARVAHSSWRAGRVLRRRGRRPPAARRVASARRRRRARSGGRAAGRQRGAAAAAPHQPPAPARAAGGAQRPAAGGRRSWRAGGRRLRRGAGPAAPARAGAARQALLCAGADAALVRACFGGRGHTGAGFAGDQWRAHARAWLATFPALPGAAPFGWAARRRPFTSCGLASACCCWACASCSTGAASGGCEAPPPGWASRCIAGLFLLPPGRARWPIAPLDACRHYMLLDLCYACNLMVLAHAWVWPASPCLARAAFAFNAGPLTTSVLAFRNSLVPHDIDKACATHTCAALSKRWILRQRPALTASCAMPRVPTAGDVALHAFGAGVPVLGAQVARGGRRRSAALRRRLRRPRGAAGAGRPTAGPVRRLGARFCPFLSIASSLAGTPQRRHQ